MFPAITYENRRKKLKQFVGEGVILFTGNDEVGMNYSANVYPFRQDSTFLYYFGIDRPGLTGVIDIDNDTEIIFGNDPEIEEIVWTGQQESLLELAAKCGVANTRKFSELVTFLQQVDVENGRKIHYLPPYRYRKLGRLSLYLEKNPDWINRNASIDLIKAVVNQRSVKEDQEITEIEKAVEITAWMHKRAIEFAKPGMKEMEVVAELHKIALESGPGLSFPSIVTVRGEILHNQYHGNTLRSGQMLLVDAGAESNMHYAGDMTRTFPVSENFTSQQRQVYQIVLDAQLAAVGKLKQGTKYLDVHLTAAATIARGLKELGLMRGDMDEAVKAGAHALFFQHGLGHMMGIDVHDMENLGEQYVGYTDDLGKSSQFGLSYLRLGRDLEPGFVLTVEPGIYFIPTLIDIWKKEKRFDEFIDYDELEKFRDFGGIRIEDDYLITADGSRKLGPKVPKEISEIESIRKASLS